MSRNKGTMMKSIDNLVGGCLRAKGLGSCVAGVCILTLTVIVSGCGPWASPGESAADASRRRQRTLQVNYSEMMADIDKFLMLDEPSRLTDRHLP